MKSNLLNRAAGLLTMITLFMAFSYSTIAQQDMQKNKNDDHTKFNQTANELTQSLTQRVNLTEDQREEINTALIDYQKNIADIDPNIEELERNGKITEMHNSIRTNIENILDDNQMTTYNEIRDQWWSDVQTRIHPSTVRQNKTDDKHY